MKGTVFMGRKELNIPDKYKDIRLWSYSRVNEFVGCRYSYFLHRILKKHGSDNIYGVVGNLVHDILERYYNKEILYEQMIDEFEDGFTLVENSNYKFSSDPDKNESMKKKYYDCIIHFFNNHQSVPYKIYNEFEFFIPVDEYLFLGYVDAFYIDENKNVYITDYKTSTIYSGKKILQNQKQLVLYAYYFYKRGIPVEKIIARWNFLKYLNVSYLQKNGKLKTSTAERNNWVVKIKSRLQGNLKELGWNEAQIETALEICMSQNSIKTLPKEVQELYTIEDAYVYVELNEETIQELIKEMKSTVKRIISYEDDYFINGNNLFEREDISQGDSFFCSTLCGYNKHCKYFQEYLEDINMNRTDGNELSAANWSQDKSKEIDLDAELDALLADL